MQIELFGCTSAGKSSLARHIVRSSRKLGMGAVMSEDFVLTQARLNWIRGRLARTLLVDLLSLAACLRVTGAEREFLRFAAQSVRRLPAAVPWHRRLNIARNVFKKTGIREIIRRHGSDRQLVVMDEGTLQTAHYLFVQLCAEPDPAQLREFLERVPLPDVPVYVREEERTLIRRTITRGHKRIPDRSHRSTALFMKSALWIFSRIADDRRVRERLLVADRPAGFVTPAAASAEPGVERVLEIIRAGMTAAGQRAIGPLEHAEASNQ
jgi:hypothetical protein